MLKAIFFATKSRLIPLLLAPGPFIVLALSAWISPESVSCLPEARVSGFLWNTQGPGYGLIKATVLSAHGRFEEALALNPLIAVAFPLLIAASCYGVWILIARLAELFRNREVSTAIISTYLIITFALGMAALSPVCVPHAFLTRLVPECTTKARGAPPCLLCGMTTAYLEISNGHWAAAASKNRGAVALFLFSLCNLTLSPTLAFAGRRRMEVCS
jgi:hypothetical protein